MAEAIVIKIKQTEHASRFQHATDIFNNILTFGQKILQDKSNPDQVELTDTL